MLFGSPNEFIKVQYSYSIGDVVANSNFGGCFGSTPDVVTFCYYLDEAVENPTCIAGIAKSVDQLRKQTAYEWWDFVDTWTMAGREDYPFPELKDVPLVLPEDTSHKHNYTSAITIPATHLAEGVMTYTCECGDTYTEAIKKTTDHSYDAVVTAPTCIAKGYTTYTCECGYIYDTDFVNALGHYFEPTVTAPTCTTKGYTTYTCACGETYTADSVDATGHNFVPVVTAPTCVKYGYTTFVCICGENYVGDYVSVKGHIDNNNDYKCDYNCGFEFEKLDTPTPSDPTPSDPTKDCSCDCHNSGLAGLLFKLINFFQKLFGMNKVCACGVKH